MGERRDRRRAVVLGCRAIWALAASSAKAQAPPEADPLNHAFAKLNVRTTAGHIRSNCYGTFLTGILNNFSFFSMLFRIENHMGNAFAL